MNKLIISLWSMILFSGTGAWAQNAPSNLTATAVSDSQINLSFIDHSSIEDGFLLQRGLTSSNFVTIAKLGANVTNYSDLGLAADTTYYYRVRAFIIRKDGTHRHSYFAKIASAKTLPAYTYAYQAGEWGACSATACGTSGIQDRSVTCNRNDGVSVADSYCSETKPATSQTCEAQACIGYVPPSRARGATIINVKDKGALGDGVADDTAAIQSAINSLPADGGTVFVPAGSYMVDALKNLKLRSKMHLQLDPEAKLIAKTNGSKRYYILKLTGLSDVEVSGGQLIGDRDTHTGTEGEWGYGMSINASKRVTIRDMKISKCWGDGMGVWPGTINNVQTGSEDVVIHKVISTMNRRQGLSIGMSNNVLVRDSEFSYTQGTAPQYGIDIEPDPPTSAQNVTIMNCKIHHNVGGILVYKRTSGITIKGNELSYNWYGTYTVATSNGVIADNVISHNKYNGSYFAGNTVNYELSGNIFRNNYTSQKGITNDINPLIQLTGIVKGTSGHVQVQPGATVNVLTNSYAK